MNKFTLDSWNGQMKNASRGKNNLTEVHVSASPKQWSTYSTPQEWQLQETATDDVKLIPNTAAAPFLNKATWEKRK